MLESSKIIPDHFKEDSKVWIFQVTNFIPDKILNEFENDLKNFIKNWKSHQQPVQGSSYILFNKFIIISADETTNTVGGCSIDSMFNYLKKLEEKYALELLNRTNLVFYQHKKFIDIPFHNLKQAIKSNTIDGNARYFNNAMVTTKKQLLDNWIIPAKQSHIFKMVNIKQ